MRLLLLSLLFAVSAHATDVKLSALPLGVATEIDENDSFPYVDNSAGITKRLKILDLSQVSSLNQNVTVITANYSALSSDHYILSNSSGTVTLTLPNIVSTDSRVYEIKQIGSGTLIIQGYNGSQLIDGETDLTIDVENTALKIVSKGGLWYVF